MPRRSSSVSSVGSSLRRGVERRVERGYRATYTSAAPRPDPPSRPRPDYHPGRNPAHPPDSRAATVYTPTVTTLRNQHEDHHKRVRRSANYLISLWGSTSRPGRVTCRDRQPGMIAAVSLRVLYLIVSRLLSWLTLLSRATASRASSYSSYATRLPCSAEPTRGLAWTGPTERYSLHSSDARRSGAGRRPRTPSDSPGRRGAGRSTRDAMGAVQQRDSAVTSFWSSR